MLRDNEHEPAPGTDADPPSRRPDDGRARRDPAAAPDPRDPNPPAPPPTRPARESGEGFGSFG